MIPTIDLRPRGHAAALLVLLCAGAPACGSDSVLAGGDGGDGADAGGGGEGGGGPTGSGRDAEPDGTAPSSDAASPDGHAETSGGDAAPGCGASAWPTYGHDPQRTSASDGCITGPLTLAWTASGLPVDVDHAIASGGAVYSSSTSAVVDKILSGGTKAWEWSPMHDFYVRQWTTFAFGKVLVDDDGLFLVDDTNPSGATRTLQTYDDWGQNTADADRFYVNGEINSPDGPGLYVGAYDKSGHPVWTEDSYKQCGNGGSELNGSLAVDGAKVFRGAIFVSLVGAPPFTSGVKSFDAATGAPGWNAATTPESAMSAGGGDVYLIENTGGAALVARKESDGTVAWSASLGAALASVQAPVIAAGKVIIATDTDVRAFSMATGAAAWTAPSIRARTLANAGSGAFDRCPSSHAQWATFPDTSLAAALGSDTLVVTAQDGVHILSLGSGIDLGHAAIAKVTGPLKSPVIVGKTVYAIDTGAHAVVALGSP